ncbi:nuclear pore complex protein NUP50A-like [Actinidia eriantha]|uniref:nuclear pore complex protein NUP50A-like n=1 Tax=Actinidia eriantha TaxID=165200 RepID=UPI00258DA22F|nr:nuclear pore complex protein NUP50A-like [Actinidia eriantha]
MGDPENTLQTSKKRAAGRELSRDNPGLDDDDESSEQETGTFKKASDEVLANRRILKVRRPQTSSTPSATSSNPFAGIHLVPSTDSSSNAPEVTKIESEKTISEEVGENYVNKETNKAQDDIVEQTEYKAVETESVVDETKPATVDEGGKPDLEDEKTTEEDKNKNEDKKELEGSTDENNDKKDNGNENIEKSEEAASLSSFQQLSSNRNAFTGLAGTGFSSSTFSFGAIPNDRSPLGSVSGLPSFGFTLRNNGNSSLFSPTAVSIANKSKGIGFPSKEILVETGEENEKAVFTADSVLFEFVEGGWKERGKGELKVNVSTTRTGKARLVMRAKGLYRLILNASLYPDMKMTSMEKKGVTFACMNSTGEGKDGLSTFALKFKDGSTVEEFRAAVAEHKSKTASILKTPENSP